ncbi:MAG: thiamine-phosphate kinase, partial [Leptospiraceae bacterium]|nr:thiamine-phosphate kinase [Leptospiraceae bacterium]
MKEENIIKNFFPEGQFPQDDCFFWKNQFLITTDTMAEGTHFLHEWSSPEQLAIKLIEVNISDIAASGGSPELAFLNLGLSKISARSNWINAFSEVLKSELNRYEIQLAGGDTFFSQKTCIGMTLIGKTEKPINRDGGKEGDFLYLSGKTGLSLLGYRILKGEIFPISSELRKQAVERHLSPRSRLSLSKELLREIPIHAMMDVTDGIIQDASRLALASGLQIEIQIENLPFEQELQRVLTYDDLLSSGEELELLFLSP